MERKVTPNQMCYCFVILAYLIWKIFELRQKVVLFVLDSFYIYIYIYIYIWLRGNIQNKLTHSRVRIKFRDPINKHANIIHTN